MDDSAQIAWAVLSFVLLSSILTKNTSHLHVCWLAKSGSDVLAHTHKLLHNRLSDGLPVISPGPARTIGCLRVRGSHRIRGLPCRNSCTCEETGTGWWKLPSL